MYISTLLVIIVILVLFEAEEILRLAVGGFLRFLAYLLIVHAFILGAGLACYGLLVAFHAVAAVIGHDTAETIVEPIVALTVIVGPFLFLADSKDGFVITKAVLFAPSKFYRKYTNSVRMVTP